MKYVMLRVKEGEVKTLLTDCFVDAKGYIRVWSNDSGVATYIETQYQELEWFDSIRVLHVKCKHYDYFYHVVDQEGWDKLRKAGPWT